MASGLLAATWATGCSPADAPDGSDPADPDTTAALDTDAGDDTDRGDTDVTDTGPSPWSGEATAFPATPGAWTAQPLDLAALGLTQFWPVDGSTPPVQSMCSHAIGDLDQDGRRDDFVYSCFPGTNAIAACAVDGVLQPCAFAFPADYPGFRDAGIWDLDGDGDDDLVTLSVHGDQTDAIAMADGLTAAARPGGTTTISSAEFAYDLDIWRAGPDGRWTHDPASFTIDIGGCYINGLELLDLDGDGRNEIVLRGADPCGIQAYAATPDGRWRSDARLTPPGQHSSTAVMLAGAWSPDGSGRDLLLLSLSGFDAFARQVTNGTTCWQGRPGAWSPRACDDALYHASTMGGALGTFAGPDDGHLDLVVSDVGREILYGNAHPSLFDGDGAFRGFSVGPALGITGVARTDGGRGDRVSWACMLPDIDRDGDLDIACANGFEFGDEVWDHPFVLWRHDDTGFTRLDDAAFTAEDSGRGLVTADLNGDGCLDLFPARLFGEGLDFRTANVLINGTCDPAGRTLTFRTRAGEPAWQAIAVAHYDDGRAVAQHLAGTGGYASHGDALASFGPGLARLDVTWTDGSVQTYVPPFAAVIRQR